VLAVTLSCPGQLHWEVNLIGSNEVNAFCMPDSKIAVFTGLLDGLHLTDDEAAIVVGHEMAHALREHVLAARAGFNPDSAIGLWEKMDRVAGAGSGPAFRSTHPSGPDRIQRLQENIPRVCSLCQEALAGR